MDNQLRKWGNLWFQKKNKLQPDFFFIYLVIFYSRHFTKVDHVICPNHEWLFHLLNSITVFASVFWYDMKKNDTHAVSTITQGRPFQNQTAPFKHKQIT